MAKLQPAHRTLVYTIDADGSYDIDLAKDLSAINRRLYRQGMQYYVSKVTLGFVPSQTVGYAQFSCKTAGDTWMVHNAWTKGYNLWRDQVNDAKDKLPSIEGKWADFKIFMNNASRTWDFLNFTDSQGDAMGTGDWSYSKMFLDEDGDNTDDFFLHMMGANDGSLPGGTCNSASLLANYEDVLQIPQQAPELPDNANISLFTLMSKGGEGTELNNDLVDYMETDNDEPPYSTELVPGAKTASGDPWVYREVSIKTAQAPSVMIPGFAVPLGLLAVKTTSSTDDNVIDLIIELVPGKYKGIQYESWA